MHRRRVLTGLLVGMAAVVSVLLAPMAWAGEQVAEAAPVTERPASPADAPAALANTGLNIVVPIAIGLAVLLVGIALVAWALLRRSRSRGSHS